MATGSIFWKLWTLSPSSFPAVRQCLSIWGRCESCQRWNYLLTLSVCHSQIILVPWWYVSNKPSGVCRRRYRYPPWITLLQSQEYILKIFRHLWYISISLKILVHNVLVQMVIADWLLDDMSWFISKIKINYWTKSPAFSLLTNCPFPFLHIASS